MQTLSGHLTNISFLSPRLCGVLVAAQLRMSLILVEKTSTKKTYSHHLIPQATASILRQGFPEAIWQIKKLNNCLASRAIGNHLKNLTFGWFYHNNECLKENVGIKFL